MNVLREPLNANSSVVVGAAKVVAAVGANQLALVAGEAVRASGADLAVVIDGGFGFFGCFEVAGRTTL